MKACNFHVLILTPHAFPSVTGNAVTVERWRRLLTGSGVSVSVMAADRVNERNLHTAIAKFAPHLVHGHHVLKSGLPLLVSHPAAAGLPLVISPAGTDIHGEPGIHGSQEQTIKILRRASVIVSQNDWLIPWLREAAPDLFPRVVSVPKSVASFGDNPFDLRKVCGWQSRDIIFFLPAGIRPIKGNLECLPALEAVHQARPHLRVVFAGQILDKDYGNRFLAEIDRLSTFARFLSPIPPEAMTAAYASADIVLNASAAEGLSNALLEAMACGRPILATDIAGNRRLIRGEPGDEPSGILYDPASLPDFLHHALALVDDKDLREALGRAGQIRVATQYRPAAEASGLLSAYTKALQSMGSNLES